MGKRINIKEVYRRRIEEIDKQIKAAVYKKQWVLKKELADERKRIEKILT